MTEPFNVVKYGSVTQVPRALLLDAGLVEPTEAEAYELAADRAEYLRRQAIATEAWPLFVAALDAITDPVARAILDLHSIGTERYSEGECLGCDIAGYEAEQPCWPCRTVTTIAVLFGIEVHPDLHYAEQYQGRPTH